MQIRKLRVDEIECRAQIVKETGCSLLLYKDARADMKILDETFGIFGWQREHYQKNNNLFCTVSVWDEKKEQWIQKEDVGVESRTEKEKGQASDAFKRACFNLGIGRELYTSPFIWIKLNSKETYQKNGSYRLKSKVYFDVAEIDYEGDKISRLVIIDQNGRKRYDWSLDNNQSRNTGFNRNQAVRTIREKASEDEKILKKVNDFMFDADKKKLTELNDENLKNLLEVIN